MSLLPLVQLLLGCSVALGGGWPKHLAFAALLRQSCPVPAAAASTPVSVTQLAQLSAFCLTHPSSFAPMYAPYETDALLSQYLLLHYGSEAEVMPYAFGPRDGLGFPLRCVRDTGITDNLTAHSRVLEVGCAVGRGCFELARRCTEVIGVDFSQRFIDVATCLRDSGFYGYSYPLEGALSVRSVAAVPPDVDRSRVHFVQADAECLPETLGVFDAVAACNLICRLHQPQRFLARLPQLLKPGGRLLLTTPYSWLEQYTPQEHWLGGSEAKGMGFNGLQAELEPHFQLLQKQELPFVIREHLRKYQWGVAQATLWERR